jgi:hypothetical protein
MRKPLRRSTWRFSFGRRRSAIRHGEPHSPQFMLKGPALVGFGERLDVILRLTVLDGKKRDDLIDAERVPPQSWAEFHELAGLKLVLSHIASNSHFPHFPRLHNSILGAPPNIIQARGARYGCIPSMFRP